MVKTLRKTKIGQDFENRAFAKGYKFVAGVDEVGRGCLAGPVVAGAVILDRSKPMLEGVDDSKKISKKKREVLSKEIKNSAVAYAFGQVEADEIDQINILEATKKAMIRAVRKLDVAADFLLIDALELKNINLPQKGIIKGDSISLSVAAASIIAKVYRDNLMKDYANAYPEYGFERHAGYGTKAHFEALKTYGTTPIHRLSFKGVV